ncbi:MAG: competence/damage-inducible protein A [Planctomycetia bacterium]|nr:competence/damage-inducible protein A [Planctomycetia bacterium]
MKCEIISIGSEITSGRNLDTNSQWLSRRLAENGLVVGWHTTIADDLEANIDAFRIASRRAKVILITGGLGPTQDDLTREALAVAGGVALVFDADSCKRIEEMFAKRGRVMPERNRVQAMFPAGAEPIINERGTAPGVYMNLGDAVVAAMPGVPNEMFAMFNDRVLPRLLALGLGGGVLVERKINTFGAGESHVEEKLFDLTRRGHVPEVGITVSDATIALRILAHGATRDEAMRIADPIEATIRERLGELVFGVDDEELQHAVMNLLKQRRKTLTVAEGLTGGLVGELLTTVPGSGAAFLGGIVAYDNRLKQELLGVPSEVIDAAGVVSAQVAEAMAAGCRVRLRSDLAVSAVGVAGPGDLGPDKPAGMVYVGLAWEGGTSHTSFSWLGTRADIRRRAAKLALNVVRLKLLQM